MRGVHLYFVKLFGCYAVSERLPVDIAPFSASILNNKAHPDVYLQFGVSQPFAGEPFTGRSHIETSNVDGSCVLAVWRYSIDGLTVAVIFDKHGKRTPRLNVWHPRFGAERLPFIKFSAHW
jgi:hypothetical protein